MSDKIPILVDAVDNTSRENTDSLRPSSSARTNGAGRSGRTGGSTGSRISHTQYEELMDGVPCPSCRGTGRIPKELERQLVALIPIDDKRLRPRRTWMWVSVAVFICLVICALLLFFLIPRSINLDSDDPPITAVAIFDYQPKVRMVLNFLNAINVTNGNFFAVQVVNATSNVNRVLFPDRTQVIGRGAMVGSVLNVPMQSSNAPLTLNHTVTLTDWSLAMCEMSFGYIRVYFQFTVTFEYFNHREQDTLENSQLVCCAPSGDCKSSLREGKHFMK